MNNVIKISGLDCANCARELEEEIEKLEGVASVTVDFVAQKVIVDCAAETLEKVKYVCNHFEEVKVVEEAVNTQPNERVFGEKIKIANLCCANCARELEEELNKIEGVEAVVDFMNMRVILNAQSPESREKAIYAITHFEDVKIVDGRERKSTFKEHKKDILCLIAAVIAFIPALVLDLTGVAWANLAARIVTYTLYGISYFTVGHPVLINTVKNISKGRIFDENFLMTVASIGAILLGIFAHDGFFEGVAVMLLYQLGELLQSVAVGASRNSITDLMDLKSDSATIIIGGEQRTISPEELKTGDVILIKAGEKVPVDCKIIKGETSLDMKSLNGEPLPRAVAAGDEILSGSINLSGIIEAEVIREYKNSAVAKILELVENSTAKKSKPEKFISKFAKYYTPAVCIAAILVAAIIPTIICGASGAYAWSIYKNWIYNALTFLVISCPCALVISVPLSYFGGIGRCARFGILVKGSTCLDELATCNVAAFDKTGTITEGTFKVREYSNERALALAAAAEKYSSHPIAAAFAEIPSDIRITNAEELAGRGVRCTAEGKTLLCGNAKLLEENNVAFSRKESVSTLVYVALDGAYVGVIEIDDGIKEGVKDAISSLKAGGIAYTEMLTGDLKERAQAVAAEAGIDGCMAELLPDKKLERAQQLKEQGKLIYVGDGINDAPVMTAADCSVSMGKVGSDAAIEASDIVLVSDNIALLPKGRKIAKGTRRIVVQNIVGSLFVKFGLMICDIVLASLIACGVAVSPFPLIVSVVADVGVMLVAVLNSMRTALIK
ncbi:MAG: cadmium-translocating P-type ATPase [Clostridiales bacterium]|nr:cadmium-translocating P-type ATPase [Clostridiales bacterium]